MSKSDIQLGSGKLYLRGLDESELESIDISEAVSEDEPPKIQTDSVYGKFGISAANEATFECDMAHGHDWLLTHCRKCGWGFPITLRYALMYGFSGWLCPLCTAFRRGRVSR